MSRIAYVDGRYVSHRRAGVHIEDRGYQFADGVYEVLAVSSGHLVDEVRHLARLTRSLAALQIPTPMSDAALGVVIRELIRRNGVTDGIVYLQVTRGTAPREHAFPKSAKPVLVVTSRRRRSADPRLAEEGVAVITIPDIRWQRCDIKSVALIANVLGKQRARVAGAYEAWQFDREGFVTEGTSTNAWIVTAAGEVVTLAADNTILNGITRLAICDMLRTEGCRLVERPFTVAETKAAREAFLTSTTTELLPVVRIDNDNVGNGAPGLLTRCLRALYLAHAAEVQ
ncbi:MAG TPA: D-amino-acid transaminase [Stellaceae bacterium]